MLSPLIEQWIGSNVESKLVITIHLCLLDLTKFYL